MREIKFRAWDAKNKEIYYPTAIGPSRFALDNNEYYCALACDYGYEIGESLPDTLMQYTGLKDKNGKDIYEGDIIKIDWGSEKDSEPFCYLNNPLVIEFRSYSWFPFSYGLSMPKNIEIIGNIYENPELLEKPDNSEGKL